MSGHRFFKLLNENASMPKRATKASAGHDFKAAEDKLIAPGEQALVKTGVAAYMQPHEVLLLFVNSGNALKRSITLQNAVGVVDSDYFPNEIGFIIRNEGDRDLIIEVGDVIGQGVCLEFKAFEGSDTEALREGGFGSTRAAGKET